MATPSSPPNPGADTPYEVARKKAQAPIRLWMGDGPPATTSEQLEERTHSVANALRGVQLWERVVARAAPGAEEDTAVLNQVDFIDQAARVAVANSRALEPEERVGLAEATLVAEQYSQSASGKIQVVALRALIDGRIALGDLEGAQAAYHTFRGLGLDTKEPAWKELQGRLEQFRDGREFDNFGAVRPKARVGAGFPIPGESRAAAATDTSGLPRSPEELRHIAARAPLADAVATAAELGEAATRLPAEPGAATRLPSAYRHSGYLAALARRAHQAGESDPDLRAYLRRERWAQATALVAEDHPALRFRAGLAMSWMSLALGEPVAAHRALASAIAVPFLVHDLPALSELQDEILETEIAADEGRAPNVVHEVAAVPMPATGVRNRMEAISAVGDTQRSRELLEELVLRAGPGVSRRLLTLREARRDERPEKWTTGGVDKMATILETVSRNHRERPEADSRELLLDGRAALRRAVYGEFQPQVSEHAATALAWVNVALGDPVEARAAQSLALDIFISRGIDGGPGHTEALRALDHAVRELEAHPTAPGPSLGKAGARNGAPASPRTPAAAPPAPPASATAAPAAAALAPIAPASTRPAAAAAAPAEPAADSDDVAEVEIIGVVAPAVTPATGQREAEIVDAEIVDAEIVEPADPAPMRRLGPRPTPGPRPTSGPRPTPGPRPSPGPRPQTADGAPAAPPAAPSGAASATSGAPRERVRGRGDGERPPARRPVPEAAAPRSPAGGVTPPRSAIEAFRTWRQGLPRSEPDRERGRGLGR